MDSTAEQTFAQLLEPYRSNAVAEALGVDIGTVSRWKTGKSFPGVDKIPALSDFLRVDPSVLLRAIATQKAAA